MSERDPFSSGDLLEGPQLEAKMANVASEVRPGLSEAYLAKRQALLGDEFAVIHVFDNFIPKSNETDHEGRLVQKRAQAISIVLEYVIELHDRTDNPDDPRADASQIYQINEISRVKENRDLL